MAEVLKNRSPWRNRLARLTVNQEVGSSSLPGDDLFFHFFSISINLFEVKKKTLYVVFFVFPPHFVVLGRNDNLLVDSLFIDEQFIHNTSIAHSIYRTFPYTSYRRKQNKKKTP